MKGKSWSLAAGLMVAVLLGTAFGCNPSPTTKPSGAPNIDKQPDKKGEPVKKPNDDIGY